MLQSTPYSKTLDRRHRKRGEENDPFVKDDRFLLGLSGFNQLNQEWIAFAQDLRNPNKHEET